MSWKNPHQSIFLALLATTLALSAMIASAATYSPVDFSSQANFTWVSHAETDPNGETGIYLPTAPLGQVTLAGIPFNITSNTQNNQAWNAYTAAGSVGENPNSQPESITIPVGRFGVTDVYTLINTYWGLPGPGEDASIIFSGSGGASYTKQLIGGTDIRDWNNSGSYENQINGTTTVNVYSYSPSIVFSTTGVLDMQHFILPSEFATQTLTSIELVDNGATQVQRTVLDGVTVASVPEPSSIGLGIMAFIGLLRR